MTREPSGPFAIDEKQVITSTATEPTTPPKRTLRVHVFQVAYGDEEPVADRVARVADLVREQRGPDLVVLPELRAHGGFAFQTWAQRAETFDGPTVRALSAAAKEIGTTVHAGSFVERAADGAPRGREGRGLWNTSVLLTRDGTVQKT